MLVIEASATLHRKTLHVLPIGYVKCKWGGNPYETADFRICLGKFVYIRLR